MNFKVKRLTTIQELVIFCMRKIERKKFVRALGIKSKLFIYCNFILWNSIKCFIGFLWRFLKNTTIIVCTSIWGFNWISIKSKERILCDLIPSKILLMFLGTFLDWGSKTVTTSFDNFIKLITQKPRPTIPNLIKLHSGFSIFPEIAHLAKLHNRNRH